MHILAIFLLLIGSGEGSAVTGNPMRPFTEEEKVKAVISILEDALIHKDESLVTACLSERVANRKVNDVKSDFGKHVANTQAPEGKPLVSLQSVEVEINGDKATATLTAFSYGNGKRIKAVHRITFRRYNDEWFIADAEPLSVILKQIGGIVPLQQVEHPEENQIPAREVVPEESSETEVAPGHTPEVKKVEGDPSSTPADATTNTELEQ